MFRFVVLCACFAAAAAGLLTPVAYSAPVGSIAYTGAYPYAPATTYISPGYSQFGLPAAPLVFPHLIKKRNDQQQVLLTSHIPTVPLADDDDTVVKRSAGVNYVSGAPVQPVAAPVTSLDHVLKKRSVFAYAAPAISHQAGIAYGSPIIQPYAAAVPYGYAAAGYPAAPIGYANPYVAPVAI